MFVTLTHIIPLHSFFFSSLLVFFLAPSIPCICVGIFSSLSCLCHSFHLFCSCFCHIFHYQRNTKHVQLTKWLLLLFEHFLHFLCSGFLDVPHLNYVAAAFANALALALADTNHSYWHTFTATQMALLAMLSDFPFYLSECAISIPLFNRSLSFILSPSFYRISSEMYAHTHTCNWIQSKGDIVRTSIATQSDIIFFKDTHTIFIWRDRNA